MINFTNMISLNSIKKCQNANFPNNKTINFLIMKILLNNLYSKLFYESQYYLLILFSLEILKSSKGR